MQIEDFWIKYGFNSLFNIKIKLKRLKKFPLYVKCFQVQKRLLMSEREFKNPFEDYDESVQIYEFATNKIDSALAEKIQEKVDELVRKLRSEKQLASDSDGADTSIYTGSAGIALAFLRYLDSLNKEDKKEHLEEISENVLALIPHIKKRRYSFLTGTSGPLALLALLYYRLGDIDDCNDVARRLENLYSEVVAVMSDIPDEVLYGKAGFLYALLFLNKFAERNKFRDRAIREVITSILNSGQHASQKFKNTYGIPLYYEWREKAYTSAAHGFMGILYMLLKAKEYLTQDELDNLIRPTVDFILSLQFPSGNFPSSIGNPADKLVHWCHGAPSAVYLMLLAYEVYKDEKYMESARKASECVWQRGLLKKGYGLCHGVAGNGYSHLAMFQATKEVKYLYRAIKFAEWLFDIGKHGCRTPDRPLSLFEGLAGTVYFLLDVMTPMSAKFPAFEL